MTGIRHLFWDFDGTLYDSYPAMTASFLRAQKALGARERLPQAEALGYLKRSVYAASCELARRNGLEVGDVMDAFRREHARDAAFAPYEGVGECLRALGEAGIRHYLYTHRDRDAVRRLEADGLWPLFCDAVTREDGFADKPSPDALLALMQRHKVPPQSAAMVGDRDIDILAGQNAGMHTILFDPDGFYQKLSADVRLTSMTQLKALFRGQDA
ncbi:MAG TPA: HAD-IA family hydrolase [Candidatus Limiplasma stercoravium]|nr:HAD-IA family hydrolase [Candidatus Limiplasma stercoravium]